MILKKKIFHSNSLSKELLYELSMVFSSGRCFSFFYDDMTGISEIIRNVRKIPNCVERNPDSYFLESPQSESAKRFAVCLSDCLNAKGYDSLSDKEKEELREYIRDNEAHFRSFASEPLSMFNATQWDTNDVFIDMSITPSSFDEFTQYFLPGSDEAFDSENGSNENGDGVYGIAQYTGEDDDANHLKKNGFYVVNKMKNGYCDVTNDQNESVIIPATLMNILGGGGAENKQSGGGTADLSDFAIRSRGIGMPKQSRGFKIVREEDRENEQNNMPWSMPF